MYQPSLTNINHCWPWMLNYHKPRLYKMTANVWLWTICSLNNGLQWLTAVSACYVNMWKSKHRHVDGILTCTNHMNQWLQTSFESTIIDTINRCFAKLMMVHVGSSAWLARVSSGWRCILIYCMYYYILVDIHYNTHIHSYLCVYIYIYMNVSCK